MEKNPDEHDSKLSQFSHWVPLEYNHTVYLLSQMVNYVRDIHSMGTSMDFHM